MSYYCYYSVVHKNSTELVRSNNTACYAQWVHNLSKLDRVIVHLALTHPQDKSKILKYTQKEVFRYLRALQRSGLKFTFSANNPMPKLVLMDYYKKELLKQEVDTICYNIDIDLTKCSHINAQIVMFCVRFLHEKPGIADTFLRFLDDESKAKKKSGTTAFDKMLIAMLVSPGSGHSFGAYNSYNLLLGKDGFKRIITDSKVMDSTTSAQLPKTSIVSYQDANQIKLRNMVVNATHSFEEVLKTYKEQCAKYT